MPFDSGATVVFKDLQLSKNIQPSCKPVGEKDPIFQALYRHFSFDAAHPSVKKKTCTDKLY